MGRQLTEQQEVWIESFALTGNSTEAALEAKYAHPEQQGYNNKISLADEVINYVRRNFVNVAPRAFKVQVELLKDIYPPAIRLAASNSLLDRAGLKPIEEIVIREHQTIKEIESELISIGGTIGQAMVDMLRKGQANQGQGEGDNIVDITPDKEQQTTFPAGLPATTKE